jgi:hypothetical protein
VAQQRLHRLAVEGELVAAWVLDIAFEQALPFQITAHPAGDAVGHSAESGARGRLHPAQRECAVGALDVHPVEDSTDSAAATGSQDSARLMPPSPPRR